MNLNLSNSRSINFKNCSDLRINPSFKVRRILAKVDEMRAQRAKLAEDLRAETHGDDITAKLMAQVIFTQLD